jgi:predicted O-methyltransferase YrrM
VNLQEAKNLRKAVRNSIGMPITEGGTSPEEMLWLRQMADQVSAGLVAEIGMNAGYSTHAFLAQGAKRHVISFDIGKHPYIKPAKKLIDEWYPGRHDLILGTSLETVPVFKLANPNTDFSMIFIDGGHSYKTASADIRNMFALSDVDTVLVMDDTTPHRSYGKGPYKAWETATEVNGLVNHLFFVQDGMKVDRPTSTGTHVWAVGMYNHWEGTPK